MASMADHTSAHDYTNLDDQAQLKPSKKWKGVCATTLLLGVCIGMMVFVGWEQHQANMNTCVAEGQATCVAGELRKIMARPEHLVDAKLTAKALTAAALDQNVERNLQVQARSIAKQMKELMDDSSFVEGANYVAMQVKAVMDDPVVQEETKRFTEEMKAVVGNMTAPEHEIRGRRLLMKPAQSFRSSVHRLPRVNAMPRLPTVTRDVSVGAKSNVKSKVPVLGRLSQLRVATALSDAGLLSAAEQAGVFSKLEKAGAFSTAEKLLPIVDQLGLLQFLQGAINSPGTVGAQGATLAALGPIFAALAYGGFLPPDYTEFPTVLAPGVLFTGTTAAGVALLVLSGAVGQLAKEPQ